VPANAKAHAFLLWGWALHLVIFFTVPQPVGGGGENSTRKGRGERVLGLELPPLRHAGVGSLNGGEVSAKLNREKCLIAASSEVYAYLADVFWCDWGQGDVAGGIGCARPGHR
jgi:hypothetical protein